MAGDIDVAIVGGGHNGLVAATYLARAGLSVHVFERRPFTGGPPLPKNCGLASSSLRAPIWSMGFIRRSIGTSASSNVEWR